MFFAMLELLDVPDRFILLPAAGVSEDILWVCGEATGVVDYKKQFNNQHRPNFFDQRRRQDLLFKFKFK